MFEDWTAVTADAIGCAMPVLAGAADSSSMADVVGCELVLVATTKLEVETVVDSGLLVPPTAATGSIPRAAAASFGVTQPTMMPD